MEPIILFPCNSTAKEAISCLHPRYRCIGFIDDDPTKQGQEFLGIRVYGRNLLEERPNVKVLAVPGGPLTYLSKINQLNSLNLGPSRFATIIHPSAQVADYSTIGYNVLIMAGAVISALAELGNHVVVLPNAVVHHDCVVDDHTFIGANVTLSGQVKIGKNAFIGSGSAIRQRIVVGEKAMIGLGSVVVKHVKDNSCVAGNPAKQILLK